MPDTLVDAGPLIAMLSRSDRHHAVCARKFRELNCPFLTTLPVITEAMYFLHIYGGPAGQSALWKLILRQDLVLEHPTTGDLSRMDALMKKYADLPMAFADASLVAVAERLSMNRIFTLDSTDFATYRLIAKKTFSLIPLD